MAWVSASKVDHNRLDPRSSRRVSVINSIAFTPQEIGGGVGVPARRPVRGAAIETNKRMDEMYARGQLNEKLFLLCLHLYSRIIDA